MHLRKSTILSLLICCLVASVFTSCERNEDLVDIEAFTDGSIDALQNGVVGKRHCLEFIFPITIVFVDETTASVDSYQDLHQTVRAWFEANDVEKNRENKPSLQFPLQVLNMDGEIVDVTSQEELRALKADCPRMGKCKGKKGRGFSCFTLQFPVTLSIDGEEVEFEDRQSLKAAVRAYRAEAGEDAERPMLVFPVTVVYEDETTATADSQEELAALKAACQDE